MVITCKTNLNNLRECRRRCFLNGELCKLCELLVHVLLCGDCTGPGFDLCILDEMIGFGEDGERL